MLNSKCRSSPSFFTPEIKIIRKSSTICYSSEVLKQEGDCEVLGFVSCVAHNIDPHIVFYALSPPSSSWVLFTGFPELSRFTEDAGYYEMGI